MSGLSSRSATGPSSRPATARVMSSDRIKLLSDILQADPGLKQVSTAFDAAVLTCGPDIDVILAYLKPTPHLDFLLFAYNLCGIFNDNARVIRAVIGAGTRKLQQLAGPGLEQFRGLMSQTELNTAYKNLQRLLRATGSVGSRPLEGSSAEWIPPPVKGSFGEGISPPLSVTRMLTDARIYVLKVFLSTNAEFIRDDTPYFSAIEKHNRNFDLMLPDLKHTSYYERLIFGYKIGEIFEDDTNAVNLVSQMDYEGLAELAASELRSYVGLYIYWGNEKAERWRANASPKFSELVRTMAPVISLDEPIEAQSTPGVIGLLTQNRLDVLKTILSADAGFMHNETEYRAAIEKNAGNFDLVLEDLKHTAYYKRLVFAYQIGDIFNDSARAAARIVELGYVNLRQVAGSQLRSYLDKFDFKSPEDADAWVYTATNKLFHAEPSAVLMFMIRDNTLPVDEPLRSGVLAFFQNLPDFDIRQVSVNTAATSPGAFDNIANKDDVLEYLRKLQRTQALTTTPSAIPILINKGFTSAVGVAFLYLKNFVSNVSPDIPPQTASMIHGRAVRILNRNESAMTRLLEAVQGTKLAVLDGAATSLDRLRLINKLGGATLENINLKSLFGSMDSDPCDDCNSVTSPSAYFVEILEFLRSNNLEAVGKGKAMPTGIQDTVLAHLFARRPDLGNLELTCSNTNALIPYLDLANEVMESFVVHLDEQVIEKGSEGSGRVQTVIDVYNNRPTDGELLSEPQHTNSAAYSILSNKIYPFNGLPYNQALDEIRIFLKYLGTSRYELLKTYRSSLGGPMSTVENRAMVAEYLNITHGEMCALTGQSFQGEEVAVNEWSYWGYSLVEELLDPIGSSKEGLYNIDEFLPRSGMELPDLIELLKTAFINPNLTRRDAILIFAGMEEHGFGSTLKRVDTALTLDDYARIRQFMHLQRKLGWAIDEIDRAISACSIPGTRRVINSLLLEQLVAVVKLLDITSLERPLLLTFWSPISVQGENSLYSRLFLTPHITGIDPIFRPDDEGNYLSTAATISQHEIVVLATLGLTKDGMDTIRRKKMIGDELSLANLSTLYRHSLMAKYLRVTPAILFQATDIFGDPFANPISCLEFLDLWNRMQAVGVSFAQLNYVLCGIDNPLKPLFPSEMKINKAINTLLEGQAAHPKIEGTKEEEDAKHQFQESLTTDLVFTTVSSLFGLSSDTTNILLSEIEVDNNQAMAVFSSPDPKNTLKAVKVKMFHLIARAAILIKGFDFSDDEVKYVVGSRTALPGLVDDKLSLDSWKRLLTYVELRNSLPKTTDQPLSALFHYTPTAQTLSKRISELILVKQETVDRVLARFGSKNPEFFVNEMVLTEIKKACDCAGTVAIDIDGMFAWANPLADFQQNRRAAIEIRASIRAKSTSDDWAAIFKPMRDQLRHNQREALIAYLLVQPKLRMWGVIDANSLFEFFLIDVQMGPSLETSRIKQAISSVQLFIQRCFCGLEARYGVGNGTLDRKRWEWMQKYRVWEANRKVFLYPENWIEPSLRDDKSPFFTEFEADLMQRHLNTQSIEDAVKGYVSRIDEVANLRVIALYVEEKKAEISQGLNTDPEPQPLVKRVHFFARSRAAPYSYYYRLFDWLVKEWKPWGKMDIDIQNHEENGAAEHGGAFLLPVVLEGRLVLFTPQIMKHVQQLDDKPDGSKPLRMSHRWEIRLAWTEFRNGKWTAKKLSSALLRQAIEAIDPLKEGLVSALQFSATLREVDSSVTIIVSFPSYSSTIYTVGKFTYTGGRVSVSETLYGEIGTLDTCREFNAQVANKSNSSTLEISVNVAPQVIRGYENLVVTSGAKPSTIRLAIGENEAKPFHHPFSSELLKHTTASSTLANIYTTLSSIDAKFIAPHELEEPYALYNWELGLHAPMLLMEQLASSNQYDKALEIAHYVFDPLCSGDGVERVWKWAPFKSISMESNVKTILNNLNANTPDSAINNWRNTPFQPHVVARNRPLSYMKWVVMKYISILIASGDQLFRQNTLESVPLAIQYYTLAAHLYGPPGHVITTSAKKAPKTFNSLLLKWDAFSNAVVNFESAFPFPRVYNTQTSRPASRYFCVPDNPKLKELRATIDDRLYKIRHSQDINGNAIKLALFEPPIDPGALVRATANGISLSNVIRYLGGPMPNYRFRYLLQKAFEMVHELRSMGDAFLAAKEKKDSQSYELIRIGHETTINALVLDMKKLNCDEANKSLDSLRQTRNGPFARLQHFARLIGEDSAKFSRDALQFDEIENNIRKPESIGGLVLTSEEKSEIDYSISAAAARVASKTADAMVATTLIVPSPEVHTQPLGIGFSLKGGPINIAEGIRATALGIAAVGDSLEAVSVNASKRSGLLRQFQERVLQANAAGHELEVINAQIAAQQIRVTMAEKDIELQQKQIDSANGMQEFLRSKYTNEALYSWQETQLRTLYYQTYILTYDLAQKVEKTYQFERGLTDTSFIQESWDANRDGLYSAERLSLGLKRLEEAHQESRGYEYEITKHISLRQINPRALLELRELGKCEFSVSEKLFDMDFPGHYNRRIKSVSLSIPCVIGPYTSINCTMQLASHKYRVSNVATEYDTEGQKFRSDKIPIQSVAISSGQNDSGVFELNFHGERYIPFEGAGAISDWRLELPHLHAFDYHSITDAILHIRYTSMFGGDQLRKSAIESYENNIADATTARQGLFALFDLKNQFANDWCQFGKDHPLTLANLDTRLPFFTRGRTPTPTKIDLFSSCDSTLTMAIIPDNTPIALLGGTPLTKGITVTSAAGGELGSWNWELQSAGKLKSNGDLWMIVQYTLDKPKRT